MIRKPLLSLTVLAAVAGCAALPEREAEVKKDGFVYIVSFRPGKAGHKDLVVSRTGQAFTALDELLARDAARTGCTDQGMGFRETSEAVFDGKAKWRFARSCL
ncbi:MAG: hypothetical protein ACRCSU_02740 [Paracoccaceae bacterium]